MHQLDGGVQKFQQALFDFLPLGSAFPVLLGLLPGHDQLGQGIVPLGHQGHPHCLPAVVFLTLEILPQFLEHLSLRRRAGIFPFDGLTDLFFDLLTDRGFQDLQQFVLVRAKVDHRGRHGSRGRRLHQIDDLGRLRGSHRGCRGPILFRGQLGLNTPGRSEDHRQELLDLILIDLQAHLDLAQVVRGQGINDQVIFRDLFNAAYFEMFVELRLADLEELEERFPLVLEFDGDGHRGS